MNEMTTIAYKHELKEENKMVAIKVPSYIPIHEHKFFIELGKKRNIVFLKVDYCPDWLKGHPFEEVDITEEQWEKLVSDGTEIQLRKGNDSELLKERIKILEKLTEEQRTQISRLNDENQRAARELHRMNRKLALYEEEEREEEEEDNEL